MTAQEDGTAELSDPDLLDRATALGRVLFTRDKHFLQEGTRRQRNREEFAGVIYARQLYVSIGACIDDLELVAIVGQPEDFANRVAHLPLR